MSHPHHQHRHQNEDEEEYNQEAPKRHHHQQQDDYEAPKKHHHQQQDNYEAPKRHHHQEEEEEGHHGRKHHPMIPEKKHDPTAAVPDARSHAEQRHSLSKKQGRKKALLIGINYIGQQYELRGCINDVKNVQDFIVHSIGIEANSIRVLTEEADSTPPTKQNMMEALSWLVSGAQSGDSLFLHYSGHGGQVKDLDGDRETGMDDTIVPVDYEQAGQINSDDLHRVLVDGLPEGARLTCIFDCCHSGTILELHYIYRTDENGQLQRFNPLQAGKKLFQEGFKLYKDQGPLSEKIGGAKQFFGDLTGFYHNMKHMKEGGGDDQSQSASSEEGQFHQEHCMQQSPDKEVYVYSGCKDEQTSADAMIQGVGNGAMSYAMLWTLRQNPNQSYVSILNNVKEFMQGKYSQTPQLSVGFANADLNQPFQI